MLKMLSLCACFIILKICAIPHGSGNTDGISEFCVNFAKEHGLEYKGRA
ncbi:MAG: hypothetical protein ACLR56_00435 [Oscillospiraceae bacterium]